MMSQLKQSENKVVYSLEKGFSISSLVFSFGSSMTSFLLREINLTSLMPLLHAVFHS